MNDEDKKPELPIHLILGASEYSRIKTDTKPRIGKAGEPVAELTSLGWTMMSAGKEAHMGSVYLTRTSSTDYEQLCSLDVLGLQDRPDGDQQSVYEDFKEQLRRSDEGWYETGLLWKHGHDLLPNNEQGSLRRLESLLKKLQKEPNLLAQYDEVIQDQLAKGIVKECLQIQWEENSTSHTSLLSERQQNPPNCESSSMHQLDQTKEVHR